MMMEDELYWLKREIEKEWGEPIKNLDNITLEGSIFIGSSFLCMDMGKQHPRIAYILVPEEQRGEGVCRDLIDQARVEFGSEQPLTLYCKTFLVPLYEHLGFIIDEDAPRPMSTSVPMIDTEF